MTVCSNCAGFMIGVTRRRLAEIWLLGCYAGRKSIKSSVRGWKKTRVEENIEETLTFYRLPREHHKHLKSTNMLVRLPFRQPDLSLKEVSLGVPRIAEEDIFNIR